MKEAIGSFLKTQKRFTSKRENHEELKNAKMNNYLTIESSRDKGLREGAMKN